MAWNSFKKTNWKVKLGPFEYKLNQILHILLNANFLLWSLASAVVNIYLHDRKYNEVGIECYNKSSISIFWVGVLIQMKNFFCSTTYLEKNEKTNWQKCQDHINSFQLDFASLYQQETLKTYGFWYF